MWHALVLVIVATSMLSACGNPDGTEALGTLERDRVVLKATADEIITDQPVLEGSQVSAGTLLVQLDDRRQQAIVSRAQAEVAQAQARLEELRNGARTEDIAAATARVTGAEAALTEATVNYDRAEQLFEQKLAAKATLDSTLATRDEAEANLETAREALLLLTNGTRPEQLAQGAAALEAARAQLALEKHRLSELSVVATRDAYLDSLPWNVGERVSPGATLAIMLANTSPYARVYIPEPYRASLRIGDRRAVHVDGVAQALTGTLRWIANDPSFTPYYALNASDRARLVYMAEFDIENGNDLPTGVPAQVQLTDD